MDITRRHFIGGLALSLPVVSGCSMHSMADIQLYNATPTEIAVTVDVVRLSDEAELLQETITLAADEGDGGSGSEQTYANVVSDEEARVTVAVEDGPEGSEKFYDPDDARSLHIQIKPTEITFHSLIT